MKAKDRLNFSMGRVVSSVRDGNDKVVSVQLNGEENRTPRVVRTHAMSGDAAAINLAIFQRNVEQQKGK